MHDTIPYNSLRLTSALILRRYYRLLTPPTSDNFSQLATARRGNGIARACTPIPATAMSLGRRVLSRLPPTLPIANGGNFILTSMTRNDIDLSSFITRLSAARVRLLDHNRNVVSDPLNTSNGTNTVTKIDSDLHRGNVPPIVAASNPSKVHLQTAYSLLPDNATLTYD